MIDEKAFQAAIEVFERVSCDTTDPTCGEALKAAITAYEQARERVAVPGREEIAAGLSTAYQASELNADEALEFDDIPEDERQRHLWMADYVLTLLRPAPSAQPWTRDQLIAVYMDAFPTLFSSRYDFEQGGCTSRDIDRIVASLNKLFGPIAPVASAQPGFTTSVSDIASKLRWAYDHTDRTPGSKDDPWESVAESAIKLLANATVASAQGGDSERYRHAVQRSDEHLQALGIWREKAESLERDLAAERAAHQATKADCERRMNDWQDTHEQEVEQLKDDLATERAAHEKTQQAMGDWQLGVETERRIKLEERARAEAAEKRAAELEQDRDNWRDQYQDGAKVLRGRIAELERERDEALAKLEALRSHAIAHERLQDMRSNFILTKSGDVKGKLLCNSTVAWMLDDLLCYYDGIQSALAQKSDPQSRIQELERERDEARAKLEALRRACGFQGSEASLIADWFAHAHSPLASAVKDHIRRIQSALAQESAKPAELKPATSDLDLAGRVEILERKVTALIALEARPRLKELEAWQKLKALEGGD